MQSCSICKYLKKYIKSQLTHEIHLSLNFRVLCECETQEGRQQQQQQQEQHVKYRDKKKEKSWATYVCPRYMQLMLRNIGEAMLWVLCLPPEV